MDALNKKTILLLIFALPFLMSCQMGYLIKTAYNQFGLLNQRVPLEKALNDPEISEDDKRKIRLSIEVRDFAKKELQLNVDKNFTSFVKLKQPYVSYVLSASPKWRLETYRWDYPFVGHLPYKGYASETDALEEQKEMNNQGFDTFVRGVSAYSTLGWFKDPLLSSMLRAKDYDLVSTIIHESVHATLFIKNEADFNERLAVFLGNKGMEQYYLNKEGADSKTLAAVRAEIADDKLFSEFITAEIQRLEKWYVKKNINEKDLAKNPQLHDQFERERQLQFDQLVKNFAIKVAPHLKTESWKKFPNVKLNNARLLVFKTYMQDLNDFEALYSQVGGSFVRFMKECQRLEKSKDPEADLKELIKK